VFERRTITMVQTNAAKKPIRIFLMIFDSPNKCRSTESGSDPISEMEKVKGVRRYRANFSLTVDFDAVHSRLNDNLKIVRHSGVISGL
jgi:hypothetical protein